MKRNSDRIGSSKVRLSRAEQKAAREASRAAFLLYRKPGGTVCRPLEGELDANPYLVFSGSAESSHKKRARSFQKKKQAHIM